MAKIKRLARIHDDIVKVEPPFNAEDIAIRDDDYKVLTPVAFAKKYRGLLFQPVNFTLGNKTYELQVNHCINPFCKWFGLPQVRFETAKNKPYRYRISGTGENKGLRCNPDPLNFYGIALDCSNTPLSNWSVAEEIKRLATHSTVEKWEPDYNFHKEECENKDFTPFDHPEAFYKEGRSSSNSQKLRCKKCRKITNVLPNVEQSFSYHQKRNDILPLFAELLLSRTPVKRACKVMGIGPTTYYNKLEWLYRRCLEFLERYETKAFAQKTYNAIWLDTDQLIYYLNNVRKKGQGGERYSDIEDTVLETRVIVSADVQSKYVFRSDVAYDWDTSLEDVQMDTLIYKDDHLYNFARKNARLRFSFCPQPPSPNDTQSGWDYELESHVFWRRNKYIDGVHTMATYTMAAHYWLIRNMVNSENWRFISDEDTGLISALYRIFASDIKDGSAHHFLCKIDRSKTKKQAFTEAQRARKELRKWGLENNLPLDSLSFLAKAKLREVFRNHTFHKDVVVNESTYRDYAKKPIIHPLPSIDKGDYTVDCLTDLSGCSIEEIANMVFKVDNRATNAFMQQIRRSISVLERPLVTARNDGKSYIYANANPKYAQYAITILRTFYNFCWATNQWGEMKTPAQRLGLADRQFDIKDILYLR